MMKVIGYEIREGARFQPGVKPDANSIGGALEGLRQQFKGELTPADVVEAARSLNHPLHHFFEWSDAVAGHEHRLAQARGLIRSVVAIYREDAAEPRIVRAQAFTHVPEGGTSHYRDTAQAMSVKNTRDLVLLRAWRELQQWRQRYKEMIEFASIFQAIDRQDRKGE